MLSAASIAAGAGAAAIAKPAGGPPALTPTAVLAANGGAEAPSPGAPGGGAEAPAPGSAAPAPDPAPTPAVPSPTSAPTSPSSTVPAPAVKPVTTSEQATPPAPAETPVETDATPVEADPGEEAKADQSLGANGALEAADAPLVPVTSLIADMVSDAPSLIDISPQPVAAPTLAGAGELSGPTASQEQGPEPEQEQDDGEILIPVPPDDVPADDPESAPAPTPRADDPDVVRSVSTGALARTGRGLTAPLGSGLLLLLIGVGLRISVAPNASSRARA